VTGARTWEFSLGEFSRPLEKQSLLEARADRE
jgi:hypothetical protein